MNFASQTLLLTRSISPSGSRTGNISRLVSPLVSRLWAHTPRPVLFATDTSRRRQSSTMASESLNSSESDAREHRQHRNSTEGREGTPYAARAAAGAAAANSFFPLGYREGFSQWVSRLEHAPIRFLLIESPVGSSPCGSCRAQSAFLSSVSASASPNPSPDRQHGGFPQRFDTEQPEVCRSQPAGRDLHQLPQ